MMLNKNGTASHLKATVMVSASVCVLTASVILIQSCDKKADSISNQDKQEASKAIQDYTRNQGNTSSKSQVPTSSTIAVPENNAGSKIIYTSADTMPQCNYDLKVFLTANIKYPESARKNKIEGRVIVKFIVDENGHIVNPTIMRAADQCLMDEALRVVSMMPAWKPGLVKGKPVAVYYYLPIVFSLQS